MKKIFALATAITTLFAGNVSVAADSRDYIYIVGSSTVYPFATVVAEKFGRSTKFKTPKIESTGSGGGLKLFCAGKGVKHPDVTNASRRIKKSEVEKCAKNGINDIVEVLIGYDGIVMANAKGSTAFKLSRKDIYMALAKLVPGKDGKLIPNPNKTWKDVNPALPNTKIEVLGPPPSSGTRDAFNELALEGGAKKVADIKKLRKLKAGKDDAEIKSLMAKLGIDMSIYEQIKKKKGKVKGKDLVKKIARSVREDGAYIEAGENDNLIVQKLVANPNALGVFGFSFLEENRDKVQGTVIDGVAPEFDSIGDGSYPVSRPLYFYAKKDHVGVIPGMEAYLKAFVSKKAMGEDGYLVDKGMIPLGSDEYKAVKSAVTNLTPLKL